MPETLCEIINQHRYPLLDVHFRRQCKATLDQSGALVLPEFLNPVAIRAIQEEGAQKQHRAYYTATNHNVYLRPFDHDFAQDHPRNREVVSTKGCITTDQISRNSALHTLYNDPQFHEYLCFVLGEKSLYEYADPLSSINLHYASSGQELGWHYDNSSFAITLLIQNAKRGGIFEYVKDVRNADAGEMNYALTDKVLEGKVAVETLAMEPGTLVLFSGRNSMHRVTPVQGERTRVLAVLAYNSSPGIALSESARMTFFGRLS